MRKNILIHFLAGLCYMGGAIWGIIEGIDYFVNDDPVSWVFLVPLIGGLAGAFVNFMMMIKD